MVKVRTGRGYFYPMRLSGIRNEEDVESIYAPPTRAWSENGQVHTNPKYLEFQI